MTRGARRIPEELETLPHWARVAFAARCGRMVLPLFGRYWSDADPKHGERLIRAIELAERSACEATAASGLEDAADQATLSAGNALLGIHGIRVDEPVPVDETSAWIASSVAKVAELAARSAGMPDTESQGAAWQAYHFAFHAACDAEASEMIEEMQRDFDSLARVAERGRWSAATPVDPRVFGLLSEEDTERRSWWPW